MTTFLLISTIKNRDEWLIQFQGIVTIMIYIFQMPHRNCKVEQLTEVQLGPKESVKFSVHTQYRHGSASK